MCATLLDFLFPRRSLTGDEGDFVTESELRSLRSAPVVLNHHQLRSQGVQQLDRIVAAAEYQKVSLLHRAIHTLKYKRVRGVGEALGALLVDASMHVAPQGVVNHEPFDFAQDKSRIMDAPPVLCPVPLHWRRKFSRGFNQSDVLARVVGERRGWKVSNLLLRTRWTGSQVGRRRKERLVGVRNAFEIRSRMEIPSYVILIDDLSTTGATLDACAQALKKSGVKRVEGLVIALG